MLSLLPAWIAKLTDHLWSFDELFEEVLRPMPETGTIR
jgi:hypothetical protein